MDVTQIGIMLQAIGHGPLGFSQQPLQHGALTYCVMPGQPLQGTLGTDPDHHVQALATGVYILQVPPAIGRLIGGVPLGRQ